MTLYNCRHSGDQYRITKFDSDMNPQGSYLTSLEECECPAGVRPTCRHRQMLPKFIARGHVGDEWFLDFDRGGWVQMGQEYAVPGDLPDGVTMIVMDSPDKVVDVHNAIAGAVGEPELPYSGYTIIDKDLAPLPPSPSHMKRRF